MHIVIKRLERGKNDEEEEVIEDEYEIHLQRTFYAFFLTIFFSHYPE